MWNTTGDTDIIFPDEFLKRGFAVLADDDLEPQPAANASYKRVEMSVPLPIVARTQLPPIPEEPSLEGLVTASWGLRALR